MRETSSPTGRLTLRLVDPHTGRVVLEHRARNLVTLAGRQLLADLFRGVTDVRPPAALRIILGGVPDVEPPAPSLGDIALTSPAINQLAVDALVESSEAQTVDGASRIVTTISATLEADPGGPTYTLTEAGIQLSPQGSVDSVLYNRVVFGPITKTPELQMTLAWEVIF